jgi:hypothetical protein
VSRPLGSDQQRVDARRRLDLAEVDVEPVGAHQDVARPQVVADAGAVDIALDLVGQQDLDQVALVHRFFGAERLEAAFLGQVEIRRARQSLTITLQPLSRRFCAWACPWEPKPRMAIVLFFSSERSASLS